MSLPSQRRDRPQPEEIIDVDSFVVENVSDSGAGSLRSAIIAANLTPGLDFIYFNIPGEGVHAIRPTSPLPAITDAIFINGDTQPGYAPGQPLIEIKPNANNGIVQPPVLPCSSITG